MYGFHKKYLISNKFNPMSGQIIYAFTASEAKKIAYPSYVPKGTTAKEIK